MRKTKEDIYSIPAFKLYFNLDKRQSRLDFYLVDSNKGGNIPTEKIIQLLLKEYMKILG